MAQAEGRRVERGVIEKEETISEPRLLRTALPRTALVALGIVLALLVVGSPDHASARADTKPERMPDGGAFRF